MVKIKKDQSWSDLRKNKIPSRSRQRGTSPKACNIQLHTNSSQTFLLQPLIEVAWPENHHPTYIPTSYHISLWLTPTNTKYWTSLFFDFTTILHTSKFLKFIHSYQHNYWTFYFLISHTFLYSPTQLFEHFCFFVC